MSKYYSAGELLSRNAVFNISVGGRGIGKTYDSKCRALRAYRKRGNQFIYLRRYKSEIAAAKQSFLADLPPELAAGFSLQGSKLVYCKNPDAPKKERSFDAAGYFVALSTAGTQKSVAYPRVRTIIYDEFVLPPGGAVRYLSDEPRMFAEFYSTVDRFRDKCRAILLANAGTIMCPYFAAWNVMPDGRRFVDAANGYVCAEYVAAGEFGEWASQTAFGQFTAATDPEYAAYSIGNNFGDAAEYFVEKPGDGMEYIGSIRQPGGDLAIWRRDSQHWWATDRQPKKPIWYTVEPGMMIPGCTLIAKSDWPICSARWAFSRGQLTFHSARARNLFVSCAV